MKLTIKIPEKYLIEFGRETVEKEIEKMFKWLRLKQSLKKISNSLKEIDKDEYYKELEKIREESWEEFKEYINK